MAKVVLTGTDHVIANLNKEILGMKLRSATAVRAALLIFKAASLRLTPVDTGNLRQTAYTTTFKTGSGVAGEIGYTASYAPFVHEIDKKYKKGQWKFLETAMKDEKKKALDTMRAIIAVSGKRKFA